jgi:hypothetical protein
MRRGTTSVRGLASGKILGFVQMPNLEGIAKLRYTSGRSVEKVIGLRSHPNRLRQAESESVMLCRIDKLTHVCTVAFLLGRKQRWKWPGLLRFRVNPYMLLEGLART